MTVRYHTNAQLLEKIKKYPFKAASARSLFPDFVDKHEHIKTGQFIAEPGLTCRLWHFKTAADRDKFVQDYKEHGAHVRT